MIHTSRQLKALVRNISKGDSTKAQIVIRNYVMERFLARLSLSKYRNNLILKGGILVAAMVGLDNRATMDLDVTIKNLPMSEEIARKIVDEITSIVIDDGMVFEIKSIVPILADADYQGLRIILDTTLEKMHTPLKLDLSTGDIITPGETEYHIRLLFEDNTISVLAYNLETILSEKIETIISRGTVNTRMRHFYDIYILEKTQAHKINTKVLNEAFFNTSKKRGSFTMLEDTALILDEIQASNVMISLWEKYQNKFDYAEDINWDNVMVSLRKLCKISLNS